MEDAAVIDVVINPRARPVIEKAGHGSSWLAELEELLSHDEWEPVDGREALWNEVRALLAGRPQLRTYLSLPPEYETCTPGALHVFYIGHSYTSDGNRAEYGARGRVIGWSSQGTMADILFPGNGGAMFSPVSELRRAPPAPLPGGYALGESLYFTGLTQDLDSGERIEHGGLCAVVGPPPADRSTLDVVFPPNKWCVTCSLLSLSRKPPPPLPGGFRLGKRLYFLGLSQTLESGDRVVHGARGEVTGPASGALAGQGLALLFKGNRHSVEFRLSQLRRKPAPPLPGGYRVGEKLFHNGRSQKFESGDRLVHGALGEVTGPAIGSAKALAVLFPGNKRSIECFLTHLSRT